MVSYPAFLGRLASLYTLTLAIISPLPQGRGISLILLFWQRAPDFRSSRMAVRRTFSLKAVSNIRGANFFEPAPRTIYIFHLALMMRITLASLLGHSGQSWSLAYVGYDAIDPMYGPAVRCKWILPSWR